MWKDLFRRRSDFWIILLGTSVSVFGLLILFSLHAGLAKTLFEHNAQKNELSQITVYGSGGGFLKFLGGGGTEKILDEEAIAEIKIIPEVQSVSPQLVYGNLASVEIEIGGEKLRTDSLIFGEEASSLALPVRAEAELIKVIISKKLIDLYNLSLAPGAGLPQLDEATFKGKEIKILPGYSSFFPNRAEPTKILFGRITNFSDRAEIIGITVPIEVVRQLNREDGITKEKYSKLFVSLNSPRSVGAVTKKLEQAGFRVSSVQKEFKEIGRSLRYIDIILYILSGIIIVTSLLFIASSLSASIFRRIREIGILRAIGFSKIRLGTLFFTQAAVLGFLGSLLGIGFGSLAALLFQKHIAENFSLSSVALENIFLISPSLIFILIIVTLLFSGSAALLPILKIIQKPPRELLG